MEENVLRIDCDDCVMQHTSTCDDCIVTFLINREPDDAVVIRRHTCLPVICAHEVHEDAAVFGREFDRVGK